jgi:L-iditol 2-dehydrogenase
VDAGGHGFGAVLSAGSIAQTETLNLLMKAAVLYGREDVRVEEVPVRSLGAGEVRIHIEAALTCGTDLKVFKRGYHAKMIVPPAVFGHELAGTISELGSAIQGWAAGERVVVANSAPCGECFFCRHQQENLCDDLLFLNGAYAESIVVPARLVQKNLLRLKPATSFRDAALTEPLACVVQGLQDLDLSKGDRVLVIGAGPIGLMFVALAKNLGCHVTVAGRRAARMAAAQRLGAHAVIDIGDGQCLPEKVRQAVAADKSGTAEKNQMQSFDAVFEAVGKPEVWEAAVQLVRKGGKVNFFGGCPSGTNISLDTALLHYSNLTLLASFHHTPKTIRKALELIETGIIRASDFVDGESKLSELPALLKSMAAGNQAVKTFINVRA